MNVIEWGQVIFLILVVLFGVGGMIKVLFLDKDK